jgi:hypothetical protein
VNDLGGMSELEMDTITGDGDCGLTLKAGAQGEFSLPTISMQH